MNNFKTYIFVALLTASMLAGCRKSPIEDDDRKTGQQVMVTLSVKIAKVTSPTEPQPSAPSQVEDSKKAMIVTVDRNPSIATKADDKTALYNMWLFQFNADGSINGAPYRVSDEVTPVYDNVPLEVPLIVAQNQTIYLAILGQKLTHDMAAIRSLDELEATEFNYTQAQGGIIVSKITSDSDIPFAGKADGIKVSSIDGGKKGLIEFDTPLGYTGAIAVTRLMSKITLAYQFSVADYVLEGIRLKNAASLIRIKNPAKNPSTDSYTELDMVAGPVNAEGYLTAYCYVAQNLQGEVPTILTEPDRYYKLDKDNNPRGSAPPMGTSIEVWAYSKADRNFYAIYQMYVGANNTTNFDVQLNNYYNLTTYINLDPVTAKDDGRVREYSVQIGPCFNIASTISYSGISTSLISTSYIYAMDCHYNTRRITVYARSQSVVVELFEDSNCTIPMDPTTGWARLSSSPNYTAAYNSPEGFKNSITTEVIVPSKLNYYLYTDEFLYQPDGSVKEYAKSYDPADESLKRRLYVKVSTKSIGSTQTNYLVAAMDQRIAQYVGRLGGDMNALTYQYEKGLCIDQINEYADMYNRDEVSQVSSSYLSWGYSGLMIMKIPEYANSVDMYNGRNATIQLAENVKDQTLNNGQIQYTMEPVRKKANGKVDLYQYTAYNSFSARFCYDRNRDNNGNGILEASEVKWYLASYTQSLSMMVSIQGEFNLATSSEFSNSNFYAVFPTNNTSGSNMKVQINKSQMTTRCVRDIDFVY